jgi:hypothetical protein
MRVATQNRLGCSRLGEGPGLFDWLNCNNRAVFGPYWAFDYHYAVFDLSAIGHDNGNYSML